MSLAAAVLLLALRGPTQGTTPAAPDAAPRVEVRAEPLKLALPEIGRALGVPMRAAPVVGEELVLVSFASRDAVGFRDQLAKAFSGEWREDSEGTWVFNRSSALREAERRAARKKRLDGIVRSLAKSRKDADPNSAFDATSADGLVRDLKKFLEMPRPAEDKYDEAYYGKARGLDARSPSNRVVRRIMDRLPVESLDVDGGGTMRVVYSTRPTKMQLPMPIDVMPELRRYVQEQNAWADAMSTSGLPTDTSGPMYTSLQYRRERAEKPPAVALLIVKSQYGNRQIQVRAYDADGKQLLDESESVSNYDQEENEALQKKMQEHPRKVKITLTPEAKRFAEVFSYDQNQRKAKGITVADAVPFLDVTKRDPLSYGASEAIFAIARGEKRNLVARVDDTYAYLGMSLGDEGLLKNGELDASFLDYFTQADEENGWTRLTPKDLAQSDRIFYNRADLTRAMAILAQGGRMSVERQAALAIVTPDNPNEKPLYNMIQLFSGNRSYGRDDFLQLYGTLSPEQRKIAQSEVGLSFSALGDASMALLGKLAYQSDEWRLQYNPTDELRMTFKDGQDPDQDKFWNGYLREPTFSLPNGVGATGRIHITDATEDKVKSGPITQKWGQQEGEVMTAESLAQNWYQIQNPRRFPWMQSEWNRHNFDQMTLVNQQLVSMEIRFDHRIVANGSMTSDVAIDDATYTMKTLPKSFLEAFNVALRKLDEQYKDQPFPDPSDYQESTGGGRTTPP